MPTRRIAAGIALALTTSLSAAPDNKGPEPDVGDDDIDGLFSQVLLRVLELAEADDVVAGPEEEGVNDLQHRRVVVHEHHALWRVRGGSLELGHQGVSPLLVLCAW